MATDTWDNDDGTWGDWNVHWAEANWTTAVPVAAIVPRTANINVRNYTFATPLAALALTRNANINLPNYTLASPVGSPFVTRLAQIRVPTVVLTTPVATGLVTRAAKINLPYAVVSAPPAAMTPRTAKINMRWRVEPAALGPLAITRKAYPWQNIPHGNQGLTYITISWEDRVVSLRPEDRVIEISAEDRVLSIQAEDRSIEIEAEDRTINIRT